MPKPSARKTLASSIIRRLLESAQSVEDRILAVILSTTNSKLQQMAELTGIIRRMPD